MREKSDIIIEDVNPVVDYGRYPSKSVAGQAVKVEATIYRSGPSKIAARIASRESRERKWHYSEMSAGPNDYWSGTIITEKEGIYRFKIQAWDDEFLTLCENIIKWFNAGENVSADVSTLTTLLRRYIRKSSGKNRELIRHTIKKLDASEFGDLVNLISNPSLIDAVRESETRKHMVSGRTYSILSDSRNAGFSSWYELFPRSQGKPGSEHGTFNDVIGRLDDIKEMGFDIVYLTPIHPIGNTNRRGRDGSLKPLPTDPGSPWAIGNSDGGHKSINPELGTMKDFSRLVKSAEERGMKIALDIALQCSPDHPYVKEHPEWFYRRKDGTIRYAENPPKKYFDIYPFKFEGQKDDSLYREMLSIFTFWAEKGIRVFRVDNPHTKPFAFWEWLIRQVKSEYPDAVFLAEAFTKPAVMYRLSMIGFTQSYTYFTWRNYDYEIREYFTELSSPKVSAHFRPMLFPNTPDILPPVLQNGGRSAFKMRAILASTLSPLWGIYSGFELCENDAIEGREEYSHSEKYEIRKRDWKAYGNIRPLISLLNRIRREHECLQEFGNIEFHDSTNPNIIFYTRKSIKTGEILMIVVNLNPFETQSSSIRVPMELIGICNDLPYRVTDLLTGATYTWQGQENFVRLTPDERPAHILKVGE